jgi:PAS domain S-box-containing protein
MNYSLAIISLIDLMIAGVLSVYVMARNPEAPLNRLFFAFGASIAFLDLSDLLIKISPSAVQALFFLKLYTIFWLLFVAFLFHFSLILANNEWLIRNKLTYLFIYGFVPVMAYIDSTTTLFYSGVIKRSFGFTQVFAGGYWIVVLYSIIYFIGLMVFAWLAWKRAETKRDKKQKLIILASFISAFIPAIMSEAGLRLVGIYFPPILPTLPIVIIMFFAYAMVRYGLFVISPASLAQEIINTMPDLLSFSDRQRKIRMVNQTFLQTLGYAKTEVIGQPCEMIHYDKEEHNMLHTVVSQGKPVKGILSKLLKKDGSIFPVSASAAKILDDFGDEVGIVFVFKDISLEEKLIARQQETIAELDQLKKQALSILEDTVEAKNEAARSSEEYRVLIESATDQIFMVDEAYKFVSMNGAALGQLRKRPDEVLGKPVSEVFPKEISARNIENIETVFKTGQGVLLDEELNFGGNLVYVNSSLSPVKNSEGKTVAVLGVVRDITDRKRVEAEISESKALFSAMVENIPLMIFLKEAQDLRFVIFNRAGEQLLGYDRKELLGKNNLDLFPPDQAANFIAKDREVLDGETGFVDIPEESITTAKQGVRLLHTRKVRIQGADGVTKFLLGISEDITERKQADGLKSALALAEATSRAPR